MQLIDDIFYTEPGQYIDGREISRDTGPSANSLSYVYIFKETNLLLMNHFQQMGLFVCVGDQTCI